MLSKQETRKARVYIAAPFFSPEQIERVERLEKALEANPFVEEYFSPRLNQVDQLAFGSEPWRNAVFNQDINFLDWATHVVAVADFTVLEKVDPVLRMQPREFNVDADSGTAFELGYAFAKEKPVIVLHETSTQLNLMISDSLHFYTKDVADIEDYNFLKMPQRKYTGEVI